MQLTNQDKPFLSSPQFRKHRPKQLLSLRDGSLTASELPLTSPQSHPKFSSISIPDLFPMQECSLFSTRSGGTKAQFSIGQVPVLIKDQGYIKRKKTVDTFLKMKDLEIVLGAKSKQTHQINRNTSLGEVGVLHNKLKKELLQKEKFKRGKMYSNELWSTNFYNAIMDVSDLKKKSDLLTKKKFENIDYRIEEVEEYYNKLTEKTVRENEKSLREVKESPYNSLNNVGELSPITRMTSDPHRGIPPLKNASMTNFFRQTRGTSTDSPKSAMNHLAHIFNHRSYRKSQDYGDTPLISEKSSPKTVKHRPHRQRKLVRSMPEELEIIPNEDYSPESGFTGFTAPSLISPNNQSKGRIKTGFITSSASIFSGYRDRKGEKSLASLARSIKLGDETSPDSRSLVRNTSLETETCVQQSTVKFKCKTPRASYKPETQEKRMSNLLINKCMDFNNETQEMKKEFDDCRHNLDAFIRRKQISKVQERKAKAMAEALEVQKKFFKSRKNAN